MFSDLKIDKDKINAVEQISSVMVHRGPDQQGSFVDDHICFGFNRLSIIDIENGNQPFSYDDGAYMIVFNGEIYNFVELREFLLKNGAILTTRSDTEVIIALYKMVGKDMVNYLRGMFAFVIWDKHENSIFGARDPFGMKPFYYMELDGRLYCSSEAKSLMMVISDSIRIDHRSLHQYLTFQYVPGVETMSEEIVILEPGHTIERRLNDEVVIEKYWSSHFNPVQSPIENKLVKIREAMEDSVNIHMRSDVPVGLFLSGGIDSTILAALSARINPHIKTFTVGFQREGFSEIDAAKETAQELDLENISKVITPQEFIEELPRIIWHMDEPVADPSAIPLYFLAKEASKQVKVVLSGEGSDELFGGYNIYREPDSLRMFSYIPKPVKGFLRSAASRLPEGIKGKSFLQRGSTPMEERYIGNASIFPHYEKELILKDFKVDWTPQQVTRSLYDETKDYDPVTRMQYIDIHTWLRGDILVKADRMTMAHSLEARMPFLDKRVFSAASELTRYEKVLNNTTKAALRETFKDIIPHAVVDRKKLGFPVPIRHWLKDEMYDWAVNLIKGSRTEHLIYKSSVIKMLEDHRKGGIDYSRRIWTILVFMSWYDIYVDGIVERQRISPNFGSSIVEAMPVF